jgi:Kef-type K+ transport system membrane component KefB
MLRTDAAACATASPRLCRLHRLNTLCDSSSCSASFLQAVVIAAALSMSSSAFVLQLLSERGEAPTRVGSATLGILLFQDIAIIPFLVLLPLIESNGGMEGTTPDTLLQVSLR